jgi:hypothetical protein
MDEAEHVFGQPETKVLAASVVNQCTIQSVLKNLDRIILVKPYAANAQGPIKLMPSGSEEEEPDETTATPTTATTTTTR